MFLIPLVFSLISTGIGLYSAATHNDAVASAGAQALARQTAVNDAQTVDDYVAYVRQLAQTNDARNAAVVAAQARAAQVNQIITAAGLATGLLLLLLTVYVARRPS